MGSNKIGQLIIFLSNVNVKDNGSINKENKAMCPSFFYLLVNVYFLLYTKRQVVAAAANTNIYYTIHNESETATFTICALKYVQSNFFSVCFFFYLVFAFLLEISLLVLDGFLLWIFCTHTNTYVCVCEHPQRNFLFRKNVQLFKYGFR